MWRIFAGVNGKILRVRICDAFKYWVYIPAAVIAGGKLVDLMLELPAIPRHFIMTMAGILFVVSGVALIQKSIRDLSVYGEGTPNPLRPPKRLVSEGIYGLCRHPMFFGYDLAALGMILLFRSWGMLLVSFPIFIFFEYRFLKNEEMKLAKRFKESYASYKQDVPFFVPMFRRRGRVV